MLWTITCRNTPGRGGTPRSRWTRTTGRASVSRDTVDLSRPIPSAVRRTPGCRSQCGFSIGVLSSDDRCGCCWPMGATPSLVRNFEHFQSQARCCTSILNPGTTIFRGKYNNIRREVRSSTALCIDYRKAGGQRDCSSQGEKESAHSPRGYGWMRTQCRGYCQRH